MSRLRSLPVKILALAALNLLLLLLAGVIFIRTQLETGVEGILLAPAQPRLRQLGDEIHEATRHQPVAEHGAILRRFERRTELQLALWENDGGMIAGSLPQLPPEFLREMHTPPGAGPPPMPPLPPLPPDDDPFGDKKKKKKKKGAERGPLPVFLVVTADGYWFGVRTPLESAETFGQQTPGRGTLVARAPSLLGNPMIFDARPWVAGTLITGIITALCWLPFIRNLAHSIRQLRDGAERITEGHFETKVPVTRQDEVGELAEALNRMGTQLGAFVHGQKRFLGDIAHELTAPLARAQMATGILEERPGDVKAIANVREEVDQISTLVNELLRFTRAGLKTEPAQRVAVEVGEAVRRVLEREAGGAAHVELIEGGELRVLADRAGFERALGNLVRNAIRYAGEEGPITLAARRDGGQHVIVTVSDSGPGLPEDALDRVFAPFFRLDDARTRETGGTGLGLSIVKASIESSGGTVWCRNRSPRGLEVSMRLESGM